MLRRMLPFAIGLPILAGWIRITAQRSGYYDFNFGSPWPWLRSC